MKLNPFFTRAIAIFSLVLMTGPLLKNAKADDADLLSAPQASIGISLIPQKMHFVREVVPDSLSDKAGLKAGDIVLSIEKSKDVPLDDLTPTTTPTKASETVDVEFIHYDAQERSHKLHQAKVEAMALPAPNASKLKLLDFTIETSDLFAMTGGSSQSSPGAKAGMRPGDVLLSLNLNEIKTDTDLRTAMLMVKPGQNVDVEFLHLAGKQQAGKQQGGEIHKVQVETMAKPIAATPAPPEVLTPADLVNHPDRWPVAVTIKKDVALPKGKTAQAGQKFQVTGFAGVSQNLTLTNYTDNFSIAPQDTDFLEAANAAWTKFAPAQRALSATQLYDSSLWPSQVTVLSPLMSENGSINVGDKLDFVSTLTNGELSLLTANLKPVIAAMAETDFANQVLERARLAPQERPSRLANTLRSLLVDSQGQPANDVSLDKSQIFVFYYGASWCSPCRKFSPSLVQYVNRVAPKAPKMSVIFMDCDQEPGDMLAYMQKEQMPWPAVPQSDLQKSPILAGYFHNSLPQLVVLDRHGNVLADSHNKGLEPTMQVLTNLVDAGAAQ